MDLRPEVATVKRQGKLIDMSPEEVNIGEVIQVKPGEKYHLMVLYYRENQALIQQL